MYALPWDPASGYRERLALLEWLHRTKSPEDYMSLIGWSRYDPHSDLWVVSPPQAYGYKVARVETEATETLKRLAKLGVSSAEALRLVSTDDAECSECGERFQSGDPKAHPTLAIGPCCAEGAK